MKAAIIGVTKLQGQFIDPQGQNIIYNYLEIEFAPNVFAKLSLKDSNLRVMQKYAPDMFQFVQNIPLGSTMIFREANPSIDLNNSVKEIYAGNSNTIENEL